MGKIVRKFDKKKAPQGEGLVQGRDKVNFYYYRFRKKLSESKNWSANEALVGAKCCNATNSKESDWMCQPLLQEKLYRDAESFGFLADIHF